MSAAGRAVFSLRRGVYTVLGPGRLFIAVSSAGRVVAREAMRRGLPYDRHREDCPVYRREFGRVVRTLWRALCRLDPQPGDDPGLRDPDVYLIRREEMRRGQRIRRKPPAMAVVR